MHYISIFKAINNFQGTFCTYMRIKAKVPESQAFSELQRAVRGITAEIWQPSSNKLLFFPALCLCVCMCVWNAEWADYISLRYLCGLPLQSPWHLDNKGHIWKSKSAQTPMLIYSYIIQKRGSVCKNGWMFLTAENHMLNRAGLWLTLCELYSQQIQFSCFQGCDYCEVFELLQFKAIFTWDEHHQGNCGGRLWS